MIECSPDPYPIAFLVALRIAAVVTLPINLFGLYLIVFKSPKHMKDARIILFTYQLCNTCFDFWINSIIEPVMLFPLPFGKTHGLLQLVYDIPFNTGIMLSTIFVVNTISSFLQVFHYRLNFVLPNDSMLKFHSRWKFSVMRFFYYGVFDGAIIAAFFIWNGNMHEQEQQLLATYTCARPLFANRDLETFDWHKTYYMFIVFTIESIIAILTSLTMLGLSFYYLPRLPAISEKTQRLQKEFQTSLFFQAFIPLIFVMLPGLVFEIFTVIGYTEMQTLTNVMMVLLAFYGAMSSVLMIIFNRDYRIFTLQLLTMKSKVVPSESSTS